MLKTYIPPKLIEELKEAFPNKLPDAYAWFHDNDNIMLQRLAFQSGIQECIRFLEQQVVLQKESSSAEEIEIM